MSSAQASSSLAADAPRYGNDPLVGAYYARNTGTGAPVVTQLVAGTGVNLSPVGGQGVVTINSTAQGITALNPGNNQGTTTLGSTDGSVVVTSPSSGNINFAVPGVTATRFPLGANVSIPVQTDSLGFTFLTMTGLTVGTSYNYNLFLYISSSATVAISVPGTTSSSFLQFRFIGAKAPGNTGTDPATSCPIINYPVNQLTWLYNGNNAFTSQQQYSGAFTALATSVTIVVRVDDANDTVGVVPQIGANSLVLVGGTALTQINVTPFLSVTGP